MKRLVFTISIALLLLGIFVFSVSGQGAGGALLAQVEPVLIDIQQRIPISVTVLMPPNTTQAQTVTLPLTLDFKLQVEVDNNAIVAVLAPEAPSPIVTIEEVQPPPEPASSVIVKIDPPVSKLAKNNPHQTVFWLKELPTLGSILSIKTRESCCANPIYINNELVGISAQIEGQEKTEFFIPNTILKKGENEIVFMASYGWKDSIRNWHYDTYELSSIELRLNEVAMPEIAKSDKILALDNETHHIGQTNISKWERKNAEGLSYTKFFELTDLPNTGAILALQTFNVGFPNPVTINDNFIGYLPGQGEQVGKWTKDIYLYIPPEYLVVDANKLQIVTPRPEDFMIRNIRVIVE